MANNSHGTGNLRWHMDVCEKRKTHDVKQLLLSQNQGSISVSAFRFCPKKYRELLVGIVIKHNLPFSYVEYDGVREIHRYLRSDVPNGGARRLDNWCIFLIKLIKYFKNYFKNIIKNHFFS